MNQHGYYLLLPKAFTGVTVCGYSGCRRTFIAQSSRERYCRMGCRDKATAEKLAAKSQRKRPVGNSGAPLPTMDANKKIR